MAHDLYQLFSDRYDGARPFSMIVRSETQHTAAVRNLLATYGIADPTTTLPAGTYATPAIQALYDQLKAAGLVSVDAAERVGVDLETRDIADLKAALVGLPGPTSAGSSRASLPPRSTTCAASGRRRQHLHQRYAGRRLVHGLLRRGPRHGHGMGSAQARARAWAMAPGWAAATAAVAERSRPPRVGEARNGADSGRHTVLFPPLVTGGRARRPARASDRGPGVTGRRWRGSQGAEPGVQSEGPGWSPSPRPPGPAPQRTTVCHHRRPVADRAVVQHVPSLRAGRSGHQGVDVGLAQRPGAVTIRRARERSTFRTSNRLQPGHQPPRHCTPR